ncbi:MAG: TonB-dependent receptor [Saprospiraceae bacterium]|nr:TonB-dependent receptor [Saprospiraceae bacterium]
MIRLRTQLLTLIAILIAGFSGLHAQQILVKGVVYDENREPLPYATVKVKNGTGGAITDDAGAFEVKAPLNSVLVVTYTGYNSKEVLIDGDHPYEITLDNAVNLLEQVVVVGYGTARKSDLTGSSIKLKGDDIKNLPVLSATQALQGRAAGVQIVNSGAPGSAPNVRIRGTGSILGGVEPLYIVDGIITTDIRNVNNADILSVDVLKDASSTAIYGARAANGVIIIQTKAGSKEGFTINYDNQVSMRLMAHAIKMSPPGYYAEYSNDAAEFPVVTGGNITGETDWYDQITRPALGHSHNLSFNGSANKYKYYLSAGYLQEEGMLIGNDYTRFTARYNHEYAVNKRLKFGNMLGWSRYISDNKPYSTFTQAYIAAPIFNAVNPDGTYGNINSAINNVGNPFATIETLNDRSYGQRLQANLWGEIEIWKNIKFRSQGGVDYERNNGYVYTPEYYTYQADGMGGAQRNELADLTFQRDTIYQWVWDNFFTWDVTRGDEFDLKLTVGHTAERRDGWVSRATISNNNRLPTASEQWKLNFTDTALGQQNFRDPITNYFRRESYFGRVSFKWQNRFLMNATLRQDANSNFPASNRWGLFPSIGLGWIMSNEAFMQKTVFSDLKLRASFGLVGNDVISPGQFDLRPTQRLYTYFGTNRIDGATVTGIVDPNLKWETVREYDFGIEYGLFENAIRGEVDFYYKNANDALYSISYPALGFGTSFLTNAADIINKGVEFSIKWNKYHNENFSQTFGLNFTANQNKVQNVGLGRALDFGGLGNGFTATQAVEGQPIGAFWVFRTDGIFQTDEEVSNYPHVVGTKAGDLRLVDINKDGIIDNLDREHVGSYQPRFFGGFNYSAKWRTWDFGLDVFGNFGNKVYNAKKGLRFGSNYNVELDIAKTRWKPGSGKNDIPRASNVTPYPSDYFVESGSFVRINNITIGKRFDMQRKWGIDNLRVFASAQNPFIFTPYTGFTPELPGKATESGIELNIYPISSAYLVGLNLSLSKNKQQ